jgi:hypothetical protein
MSLCRCIYDGKKGGIISSVFFLIFLIFDWLRKRKRKKEEGKTKTSPHPIKIENSNAN